METLQIIILKSFNYGPHIIDMIKMCHKDIISTVMNKSY